MWNFLGKFVGFLLIFSITSYILSFDTQSVIISTTLYTICVLYCYYYFSGPKILDLLVEYFTSESVLNNNVTSNSLNELSNVKDCNKITIPNGTSVLGCISINKKRHQFGGRKIADQLIFTNKNNVAAKNTKMDSNELQSGCKNQEPFKTSGKCLKDLVRYKENQIAAHGTSNSRVESPLQNPLCPSTRFNTTLDLQTYMNVSSPGFTRRILDQASETSIIQNKYLSNKHVPVVRLSKQLSSGISKYSHGPIRIVPPEPSLIEEFGNNGNQEKREPCESSDSRGYLQAIRDLSRKRNYIQEENEAEDTVKKTRKNSPISLPNAQNKRSHDDTSGEKEGTRKKKCEDDRSIARMLSYTSSISVLAPHIASNNQTKKRKAHKETRSKNDESPEAVEKQRKVELVQSTKISTDNVESPAVARTEEEDKIELKTSPFLQPGNRIVHINKSFDTNDSSETSNTSQDDSEVIKISRGRILNRANNCYMRKKVIEEQSPFMFATCEPGYSSNNSFGSNDIEEEYKEKVLHNLLAGNVEEAMALVLGDADDDIEVKKSLKFIKELAADNKQPMDEVDICKNNDTTDSISDVESSVPSILMPANNSKLKNKDKHVTFRFPLNSDNQTNTTDINSQLANVSPQTTITSSHLNSFTDGNSKLFSAQSSNIKSDFPSTNSLISTSNNLSSNGLSLSHNNGPDKQQFNAPLSSSNAPLLSTPTSNSFGSNNVITTSASEGVLSFSSSSASTNAPKEPPTNPPTSNTVPISSTNNLSFGSNMNNAAVNISQINANDSVKFELPQNPNVSTATSISASLQSAPAFNVSSTSSSFQSSPATFGATSSSTQPSFGTEPKQTFNFNSSQNIPSFGQSHQGLTFGSNPTQNSFGSNPTQNSFGSNPTQNSFGSNPTQNLSFGSNSTQNPSFGSNLQSGFAFGFNSQKPDATVDTASSVFGSNTQQISAFASEQTQANLQGTAASPFGLQLSQSNVQTTPTAAFGFNSQPPNDNSAVNFKFGSDNFNFGQNKSSPFNVNMQQQQNDTSKQTQSSGFGLLQNSALHQTPSFVASVQPTFGNSIQQPQQPVFNFGSQPTQPAFGITPAQTQVVSFAAPTTSNPVSNKPFTFGGTSNSSSNVFAFGQNATNTASVQPFTFNASGAPAVGGFSIGTGGSTKRSARRRTLK